METYVIILIVIGTFIAGLKFKCKSKCCGCEIDLVKEENNGEIMRTIKIVKRSNTI
jgi:hypothetical protein